MCVSGGALNPRCPRHSLQYVWASDYRLYKRRRMLLLSGVILLNFSILFLANQPESKVCVHGYLFPLPVALGPVPHPIYDATAGTEPVSHRWQIG